MRKEWGGGTDRRRRSKQDIQLVHSASALIAPHNCYTTFKTKKILLQLLQSVPPRLCVQKLYTNTHANLPVWHSISFEAQRKLKRAKDPLRIHESRALPSLRRAV